MTKDDFLRDIEIAEQQLAQILRYLRQDHGKYSPKILAFSCQKQTK
ncbi:MAG: hypothetical protein NC398_13885 [Acetatifactor muris]|nr:hypothetical protein [Acetatifactor muris]MCM1528285.1 hypothetical protein [Bacteroides sp.]